MTFYAEEPVQILGQDTQGRVLVGPERREALLAEYDRSGMSAVNRDQILHAGVLDSKPSASQATAGKVADKSRRGRRTW